MAQKRNKEEIRSSDLIDPRLITGPGSCPPSPCPSSPRNAVLFFAIVLSLFHPTPISASPAGRPHEDTISGLIASRLFERALAGLDSIRASGPDSSSLSRIVLQEALCHQGLGRYARALAGFEASHAAFPELQDYLLVWEGECLEALGQPDPASERYEVLVSRHRHSPLAQEVQFRVARLADISGRHSDAARAYETIARSAPQDDDIARALYGLASAQAAQAKSAGTTYARLVKDYPESPWALKALRSTGKPRTPDEWYLRGTVYFHAADWPEAIESLRAFISKHPADSRVGMAHFLMGRCYFEARRLGQAVQSFSKAYRKYGVPAALFYLGRCAIRMNDDREGADILLRFAKEYPRHDRADEALWSAAWAQERLRDYREARRTYLRIVSGYPRSRNLEQAQFRACLALYSAGRLDEATKAFIALGEAARGSLRDQSYYWVGMCHDKLGNREEARRWYARAASPYPASFYSSRAFLRVSPEERDVLRRAALQDPAAGPDPREGAPGSVLRRADLLAGFGLYRQAGRELRAIEQQGNDSPAALRLLLRRFERVGSFDGALRVGRRLAELGPSPNGRLGLAGLRLLYPAYYAETIGPIAAQEDLSPSLVLAIIRQESSFNPIIASGAGARGLMQIMPSTGSGWANRLGIKDYRVEDLDDPVVSIRFGCREIAARLAEFARDPRGLSLSIAAYNAGPDAAHRWEKSLPQDVDELIEIITYHETRTYVKLVLRNQAVYELLASVD